MADLRRMVSNRTCQVCQKHQATLFCKCNHPPVPLCPDCTACHEAKYPSIDHPKVSIPSLDMLTDQKNALMRSVALMEECGQEVANSVDKAIECLQQYKEWWVDLLRTEREKVAVFIEAATEEAEYCLVRSAYPINPLAKALCSLSSEELLIFKYSVTPPDMPTLCQAWASYSLTLQTLIDQFSDPLPPTFNPQPNLSLSHALATIKPDQIRLFSQTSLTWQSFPLSLSISVDSGSRYLWVDSGLFCSGGRV